MANIQLQDYLKQCPSIQEIELELAQMNRWELVAVKLSSYSDEITGSWISAIECNATNDMERSRLFLRGISSIGITVDQFAKAVYMAGRQNLALKIHPNARS